MAGPLPRKVARGIEGGTGSSCHAVNQGYHGWEGTIEGDKAHVMKSPKVYAIYWGGDDEYFQNDPEADEKIQLMAKFFEDILGGKFMCQLKQYGVEEAEFVGSLRAHVDPEDPPPQAPEVMPPEYIEKHLKKWITQWIEEGKLTPPGADEQRLYIIFTPRATNIGDCLCGYHEFGRYDSADRKSDHDLFWAAIQEWHYNGKPANDGAPATSREFADSCTWAVSHEMVEAFTNPDGKGYHTKDGGEIGDICECAQGSKDMKAPIIKAHLDGREGGWWVETYWDNQNGSCYPLHITPRGYAPTRGYELPENGAQ